MKYTVIAGAALLAFTGTAIAQESPTPGGAAPTNTPVPATPPADSMAGPSMGTAAAPATKPMAGASSSTADSADMAKMHHKKMKKTPKPS